MQVPDSTTSIGCHMVAGRGSQCLTGDKGMGIMHSARGNLREELILRHLGAARLPGGGLLVRVVVQPFHLSDRAQQGAAHASFTLMMGR